MDEGRLGAVRRQQDHHRKSIIVMNDLINFHQNVYACYLNRERQNTEAKLRAREVFMKRTIVRNSYLLQCLEARKQKIAAIAPEKQILGRYGGRPIHRFSRDVDACVEWMHPRLRRLRQVERAKEKGRKLGAIMDFATIPAKLEAILEKPHEKNVVLDSTGESETLNSSNGSKLQTFAIRNQSFGLPDIFKIRNLVSDEQQISQNIENSSDTDKVIHSSLADDEGIIAETQTENGKIKTERNVNNGDKVSSDIRNNGTSNEPTSLSQKQAFKDDNVTKVKTGHRSEVEVRPSPSPLVRRPTLILPPIKSTKEMKVQGFDSNV